MIKKLAFLVLLCLLVNGANVNTASAERKIRVRFVGASFAYAKDTLTNSALNAIASRSGYDAVWEATVDQGFPTAFPKPVVRSASGLTQATFKFGGQDCTGNLVFNPNPTHHPGVNIYYRDNNKVAIEISTPHAAGSQPPSGLYFDPSAPSPCNGTFAANYAPGAGVVTTFTPDFNLPNDLNSTSEPSPYTWAAFTVNPDDPTTSIYFTFVQTANFEGFESKTVWFGNVTVELNPTGGIPGGTDPFSLYNYSPPDGFNPPADPPKPNDPPKPDIIPDKPPTDVKKWITNPLIDQVKNVVTDLQKNWNSIVTSPAIISGAKKPYDTTKKGYQYNVATREVTLLSLGASPTDGKVSLGLAKGNKNRGLSAAATDVARQSGVSAPFIFTLPQSLAKALAKGKETQVSIGGTFVTSLGAKASKVKVITLKKRSKRRS